MADAELVKMPEPRKPVPDSITLTGTPDDIRLTPNEMRALKVATAGKSLDELMGAAADDADRMQTVIWLYLRRHGHPDIRWDEAGDIAVEYEEPTPDPTSAEPSTSSPDSVDSGE